MKHTDAFKKWYFWIIVVGVFIANLGLSTLILDPMIGIGQLFITVVFMWILFIIILSICKLIYKMVNWGKKK